MARENCTNGIIILKDHLIIFLMIPIINVFALVVLYLLMFKVSISFVTLKISLFIFFSANRLKCYKSSTSFIVMKYVLSGGFYVTIIFVLFFLYLDHIKTFFTFVIMQKEASSKAAVAFTKKIPWKY